MKHAILNYSKTNRNIKIKSKAVEYYPTFSEIKKLFSGIDGINVVNKNDIIRITS